MGLIASVICFLPIVILLLANKDLDGKTKKIVTVVAAIALVLASLFSIDFNPVSAEELAEAQQTVGNGSGYWTQVGNCPLYTSDAAGQEGRGGHGWGRGQ